MILAPLPMAAGIDISSHGTTPAGKAVDLYTLTNARGLVCKVITYGAIITELHVPDREGVMGDVVLGFDNLAQYVASNPFFGCVVGRVANRIANGRFTLDGKTYTLPINKAPNCLHGGPKGFDKAVWKAAASASPDGPSVVFTHVSPDGDEGFPGALSVRMTYTLTNENGLRFDYEAVTDRTTPVNLTNHSYFNLAGKGGILGQVLEIRASRYTPVNDQMIPTGVLAEVAGGPLDFTVPKPIGRDLNRVKGKTNGYDHNYVIDGGGRGVVLAARAHDPESGRTMEVSTDQPGIQFYSSNDFDGKLAGKGGVIFQLRDAFCLETQHFPDSVNQPAFPSTLLRPGQTYRSTTISTFSAR
jgi:aldose 1-epimerase